jgi:hypothetical protein
MATVWQVLTAIGPSIVAALSRGVSADTLTAAVIDAAAAGAHARVEARTGEAPHPLGSIAVRVEDLAALLVAEQQPILSAELRAVAAELRRRAALLASIEPLRGE